MSKREKADRLCIRDFAAFQKAIGRPVDGVDRWPEDEAQAEIDAIIGPYPPDDEWSLPSEER